jgi:hypothetical protein
MKKLLVFFISVFMITCNTVIFIYGLSQKFKASEAVKTSTASYLLDSAYVLALHDYEDGGNRAYDDKEAKLWEGSTLYSVKDIDDKTAFVRLKVTLKGKEYLREYVLKK